MRHLRADRSSEDLVSELRARALSARDADLVADRIAGGVKRALFSNPDNAPAPDKDPVADAAWRIAPEP